MFYDTELRFIVKQNENFYNKFINLTFMFKNAHIIGINVDLKNYSFYLIAILPLALFYEGLQIFSKVVIVVDIFLDINSHQISLFL
jgi:hypothetical protein